MADLTLAVRLSVLDAERFKAALRGASAEARRFSSEASRGSGFARGRFSSGGGPANVAASTDTAARGRFGGAGIGGGGGGRRGRGYDPGEEIDDIGARIHHTGLAMERASRRTATALLGVIQPAEDYERAIVDTIAVTGDAANDIGNEKKLRALSASFVDMGVNATDAAKAMEFLALAGYNTEQQMQAIPNVLFAARAGSEDVIKTAGYLSDVATGFGFGADKFARVSDVMTYVNNATSTTLAATTEAMKEIGPYAQQAGLDFENMAAGVGVLANAGFRGRQAGTALRNMLLSFTKMSDPAKAELKALGLRQKDFIRMIDDGDLQGAVLKLDEAVQRKGYGAGEKFRVMNTIFQRFTSAKEMALALKAVREGDWDSLTAGAKNSAGSAEKVAARKLDSDPGRMDVMRAKLQQMQIELGQTILPGLMPIAEELVKTLGELAKWVKENPEAAKMIAKGVAEMTLLTAVAGPAFTVVGGLTRGMSSLVSMMGKTTARTKLMQEGLAAAAAGSESAAGGVRLVNARMRDMSLGAKFDALQLVAASAALGVAAGLLADSKLGISDSIAGVRSGRDTNVDGDAWLNRLFDGDDHKAGPDYKGSGGRLASQRGAGFMTKEEHDAVKREELKLKALRKKEALIAGQDMSLSEVFLDKKITTRGKHGAVAGFSRKDVADVQGQIAESERRLAGIQQRARMRSVEEQAKADKLRPMFEARAQELAAMRSEGLAKSEAAKGLRGRAGARARAELEAMRSKYMAEEMITASKAQAMGLTKGAEDWRSKLGVDVKVVVTDKRTEATVKSGDKVANANAGVFTLGLGA